jgi:hypothetical protein
MWVTKFHTHMKQEGKLYFCIEEVPDFHIYIISENVHESHNVYDSWANDIRYEGCSVPTALMGNRQNSCTNNYSTFMHKFNQR